jgi:hypothetical protein
LTAPITEEEMWKTIQSCEDNKSPGTDGLNNNFYKAMWKDIKKYLMRSIHATLEMGEMSISQKQGIISLIPKPDKDASKLKNWRPITLLNQDYKYLAKCLANRCRKILPDIVSPDQTGFVPNRQIGTNIILAQNIISHMKENQQEGIMMGIDYEKAFDTIEWTYITKSMKHFNFPPIFIEWIKTLYNNISTGILNNGHSSQFFHPSRGVRQGCPLSPILFVIGVELLATSIRQNNKIKGIYLGEHEVKISQFADDTTFYLKAKPNNIKEVFKTIDRFSKITGLRINKDKTEILLLGKAKLKNLGPNMEQYVKENIRMLGVYISKDKSKLIDLNYDPIIEKINNTIKRWQNIELSLQGKIVIVKTLIISKLIYALNVLPSPPKEKLKDIQDNLYHFVWDNKPDKVKRETLIGDYADGGLRMPDLVSQNTSLKAMWIKRISVIEGNWKQYILDKLPQRDVEYFMQCSIKFTDIPNKPHKEDFWNEALIQWCILNQEHTDKKNWELEDIYEEGIWWNSNIRVDKQVLDYKNWADQGIKFVHHLLTEEGHWLEHQELQERYNLKSPFTVLLGIQKAITSTWGNIINMNPSDIEKESDRLVDKLKVKEKGSRVIYWMLVNRKKIPPTTKRKKWENDLEEKIPIPEWKRHMTKMRKLNESTKMQTWTYKFLMRLVPYNTRLNSMGLAPSPTCTFCAEHPETIKHLYWECTKVKCLWKFIEKEFNIKVNIKIGLLGMQSRRFNKIPGLYMYLHLTRYFIHLSKCNGKLPTVEGVRRLIKYQENQDNQVAIRNNSFKKYRERWH